MTPQTTSSTSARVWPRRMRDGVSLPEILIIVESRLCRGSEGTALESSRLEGKVTASIDDGAKAGHN